MRGRALASSVIMSVGIAAAPASFTDEPSDTLAIVNVTVIPMTSDTVMARRTVTVRDGVIAAIAASDAPLPAGIRTIDGTGRYLLPGLVDMHVHLQPGGPADVNRRMLALFLVNGVTTVRNMLGSPYIVELRDSMTRGGMQGPSILTSGPVIDGPGSHWGTQGAIVATAADAARVVAEQKTSGYDFLKIYSRLTPAAYVAILAEARRYDMKVAGHVPTAVTIADALSAGQSSIEHLLGYVDAIESEASPVRHKQGWQYRMQAFDHVDVNRMPVVARETRDAGVWNCPTLVAMGKWVPIDEARRLLARDEMKYVPAEIVRRWRPWRGFRLDTFEPMQFSQLQRARAVYRKLVAAFRETGARVLAGTDTPSPFVVPGFSLHEELQLFVDAGFTPYEALETATRSPADYFGRAGTFGTVTVGARADLLLLDANPLDDVGRVKQLHGIVVRGTWIPRMQIEAMRAELASQAGTDTRR